MTKKPKRSPIRVPKRQTKKAGKKKQIRLRKDLLKEYEERIKKSGEGTIRAVPLGDECLSTVKVRVSTGSLELDRLLDGGIPSGRVVEFYGPPFIGKSTLLDHIMAEVQKMGGIAALIDAEGARDVRYTKRIGVNPDQLRVIEFDRNELHIENVLTTIYETVDFWRETAPSVPVVVGWDALGGTATREEIEKRLEKNRQPATAARVLREACRQMPSRMGNTFVCIVICNHEYENIMRQGVGPKRETYGGPAVRHLASIRVKLHGVGEWVKRGGETVGRVVGVEVVKNRLGNPWAKGRLAIISGIGVNNVWTVFQKFKQAKLLVESGSWSAINLDGEVIKFQGWAGLEDKCEEDPTLFPRLVSVYRSLP